MEPRRSLPAASPFGPVFAGFGPVSSRADRIFSRGRKTGNRLERFLFSYAHILNFCSRLDILLVCGGSEAYRSASMCFLWCVVWLFREGV